MYNHVSVDIETLDTTATAVILSVGAIAFDPHIGHVQSPCELGRNPTFFTRTSMDDQFKMGRTASDSTLRWWLNQDAVSRLRVAADTDVLPLQLALSQLSVFLQTYTTNVNLWSNPAAFDMAILRHAAQQCSLPPLSHYKATPDGSTLALLTGVAHPDIPFIGTKHDALDDAIHQAREIQWQMNHIVAIPDKKEYH